MQFWQIFKVEFNILLQLYTTGFILCSSDTLRQWRSDPSAVKCLCRDLGVPSLFLLRLTEPAQQCFQMACCLPLIAHSHTERLWQGGSHGHKNVHRLKMLNQALNVKNRFINGAMPQFTTSLTKCMIQLFIFCRSCTLLLLQSSADLHICVLSLSAVLCPSAFSLMHRHHWFKVQLITQKKFF